MQITLLYTELACELVSYAAMEMKLNKKQRILRTNMQHYLYFLLKESKIVWFYYIYHCDIVFVNVIFGKAKLFYNFTICILNKYMLINFLCSLFVGVISVGLDKVSWVVNWRVRPLQIFTLRTKWALFEHHLVTSARQSARQAQSQ